ncbi:immune-associated nucleotide-binding protein 9-like [Salvia miltiorrhiza]|uniref:immune-associated nucleotide-binding protein 9-like n=1 Tax=Salvia miltiorrhiza TaxID=226208 RepID=UPI0025ACCAE7|nr:immune-associated nucleotide-binding protein 9-like [Salvia miltiorrhiza]
MASSLFGDYEKVCGRADARTIVLVGKMGNGKSATGNSLIGREVFDSMLSLGGVTATCKLETTVLDDGRILNVVDTPGLFDSSVEPNVMAKEIANCINLAKDGIHAVLLVLSLGSRFSEEEASAFESLRQIFGGKIADYMIVVFSHGDLLRKNLTLDRFLASNCPNQLTKTLAMCGNRTAVFNNMTEDEVKIRKQREELLSLVENVVADNGGKPYTNDLFQQLKKDEIDEATQGKSSEEKPGGEQFDRFVEMVEVRLKESIANLENMLAEERAARAAAELKVLEAQAKAEHEVLELKQRLNRADELSKELQEKLNHKQFCAIM